MAGPAVADATPAGHDHHDDGLTTLRGLPPIDAAPVRRVGLIALVAGGIAFLLCAAIHLSQGEPGAVRDITTGYLIGYVFWLSPAFGAISLLGLAYLTSASWGVILRRCFQAALRTIPLLGLLFVPIALSVFVAGPYATQSPFWWSDKTITANLPGEVAAERGIPPLAAEELQHKIHDYLNPVGFILRVAAIFTIMGLFARYFEKWGRESEDQDRPEALSKLRGLGGPAVLVWAILMAVLSTDLVMSVEPVWASSMFPVIFGMNMMLCTFAFSLLVVYSLNLDNSKVLSVLKTKFRVDMGTLILAFTMLWAYSSFCQYMLVWAGNLPEEAIYYRKRGDHGWQYLAYFLMAFHWFIPFIVLLFREVKTNPKVMKWLCTGLLIVCAADVIWWILPAVDRETGVMHVPLAIAAIVAIGGGWTLAFARELSKRPLLPANREAMFLAGWGEHH